MAWGKRAGVDDLIQKLATPRTGTSLCVMRSRSLCDADMAQLAHAISHNTTLRELYLSGHELGPLALQAFAACLATNSTLEHLSLGSDKLGDEGVTLLCAGLARNPHSGLQRWDLESKSLGLAGASAIGHVLQTNKTLTSLTLSRNRIGDEGIDQLVKGVRANAHVPLAELHVTDVAISGAGLAHLTPWLASRECSLTTLQLSFNQLEDTPAAFWNAIASNASVTTLLLKACKLMDHHVAHLAAALRDNRTLIELDLSDNQLTHVACASLANGLRHNKTLRTLRLSTNTCHDQGAQLLAQTLETHNATLTYLDLGNNQLTSTSMTLLLKAQALKHLHLFHNNLAHGVVHLVPVLRTNSVIETLGVGANQLHERLSAILFDALHSHPSLKTLEMGGNTLGKEGHAALDKLKRVNHMLDVAVDKNAQNVDGSFDWQT
ncbi:hypothetical protein PsorP6_006664 [Peronosclerospora sorghi]|uniref:Uncharacterized protein n=1 Tax=Peronosclerospora sorghi TaxID=230839 RepID=A0ACC0W632_9STRA|nr:hypothetical protein PsorP6_006664 [Peronosclerospora sorghi]